MTSFTRLSGYFLNDPHLIQRPTKLRHLEIARNRRRAGATRISHEAGAMQQWEPSEQVPSDWLHRGPQQLSLLRKPWARTAATSPLQISPLRFSPLQVFPFADTSSLPAHSPAMPSPSLKELGSIQVASTGLCYCVSVRHQPRFPAAGPHHCVLPGLPPLAVHLQDSGPAPVTSLQCHAHAHAHGETLLPQEYTLIARSPQS